MIPIQRPYEWNPAPYYLQIQGYPNKIGGLKFLDQFPEQSINAAFFDPKFGDLDALEIKKFICGINRILMPSGYIFWWEERSDFLEELSISLSDSPLKPIDIINWEKSEKEKMSAYFIVIQKDTIGTKEDWNVCDIPCIWTEEIDEKSQPKEKPKNLYSAIIETVIGKGNCIPKSVMYDYFTLIHKSFIKMP